jgi:hypothetical protein
VLRYYGNGTNSLPRTVTLPWKRHKGPNMSQYKQTGPRGKKFKLKLGDILRGGESEVDLTEVYEDNNRPCEISSSQCGEYDVQNCLLGYTAV